MTKQHKKIRPNQKKAKPAEVKRFSERTKEQKETSVLVLSDHTLKKRQDGLLKLTAGYQGIGGIKQFGSKQRLLSTNFIRPNMQVNPYGPVNEDGSFAELVLTKQEVLKLVIMY